MPKYLKGEGRRSERRRRREKGGEEVRKKRRRIRKEEKGGEVHGQGLEGRALLGEHVRRELLGELVMDLQVLLGERRRREEEVRRK